jgi:hypothetical protein
MHIWFRFEMWSMSTIAGTGDASGRGMFDGIGVCTKLWWWMRDDPRKWRGKVMIGHLPFSEHPPPEVHVCWVSHDWENWVIHSMALYHGNITTSGLANL